MYLKNTTKHSATLLERSDQLTKLYNQLYTQASIKNTPVFNENGKINPIALGKPSIAEQINPTLVRGLEALYAVIKVQPINPTLPPIEQLGLTLELIRTTLLDIHECAKDGVIASKTPIYKTKNKNGIQLINAILDGEQTVEPKLGQLFDTARNGLRETVTQDMFYFFKKHAVHK